MARKNQIITYTPTAIRCGDYEVNSYWNASRFFDSSPDIFPYLDYLFDSTVGVDRHHIIYNYCKWLVR